MLLGDRICTVAATECHADIEAARIAFHPAPWAIVVEMHEWPESFGSLALPDSVSERLRPTTATVIGVGERWFDHLMEGDQVIVDRKVGYWFAGFDAGGYEARGQVRVYGTGTGSSLVPRHYRALDGIMGKIETEGIKAIGRWVLIKRDPPHQTEFGLELPDSQKYRSGKATVVSGTGHPDGLEISVGDRIVYNVHAAATTIEGLESRYPGLYPGDPNDYCFIDSREILMVTE